VATRKFLKAREIPHEEVWDFPQAHRWRIDASSTCIPAGGRFSETTSVKKGYMNNPYNVIAFKAAVEAKISKAESNDTLAGWNTEDHRQAVTNAIAAGTAEAMAKEYPDEEKRKVALRACIYDILEDASNESAMFQKLGKIDAFKKAGHFQSSKGPKRPKSADDFLKALGVP
jgi:hypothetical protein